MMRYEFIELTGFEPTGKEYEQIEAEYMGCDIDKKKFCRQWLKQGGVQRLSRQRVRKIEELEHKLLTERNEAAARFEADSLRLKKLNTQAFELAQQITEGRQEREDLQKALDEMCEKYRKLVGALEIIKGAA